MEHFSRDRRIIGRLGRLLLIGIDHDVIHQHTGHPHIVRFERAFLGDALHLRNNDAAIVSRGQRLIETSEISALLFVGEIAALIGSCRPNDRHLRNDRGKIQPVLALESHPFDDRLGRSRSIHRTALTGRIDKGIEADFGEHTRALCGGLAMHVEHDAGWNVIGRDFIPGYHLPDQRRLGAGRAGRV